MEQITHAKQGFRPFCGTAEEVEELAGELRAVMEQLSGAPSLRQRLETLIASYGGRVNVVGQNGACERVGGALRIDGPSDFEIQLSPYTTYLRDNFTIGHELGHYFLHYNPSIEGIEYPLRFNFSNNGPIEAQANRFAAALLLPAEEFRQVWKDNHGSLFLVAGHFEVSPGAVRVRSEYIVNEH